MKLLMIDNYDSFTYNLVQYLGELGADVEMRRNDAITVDEIARIVLERTGKPGTRIIKGNQPRGWIGDSPHILLDVKKMMGLGWRQQLTIEQAILRTVDWLEANEWAIGEQYFRRK